MPNITNKYLIIKLFKITLLITNALCFNIWWQTTFLLNVKGVYTNKDFFRFNLDYITALYLIKA